MLVDGPSKAKAATMARSNNIALIRGTAELSLATAAINKVHQSPTSIDDNNQRQQP